MATDVAAARYLTYNACCLKDEGKPFAKEAAMAKLFAAECAMRHTIKRYRFRGYGYIKAKGGAPDARCQDYGNLRRNLEAQRMVIAGNVLR